MPTYPGALTDQAIANKLTRNGNHWAGTTITYSFNDTSSSGNELNSTYQNSIRQAINLVSEVIGLTFNEVASGGNITLNGTTGFGTNASTSYYTSSREIVSSRIQFDRSWTNNQPDKLGNNSYGFTTILHEFLHALGIAHPGNYDASGGATSYFADAEYLQDTRRYTIMSYFNAFSDGSATSHWFYNTGTSAFEYKYPQTLMVHDIHALTQGSFNGKFGGYAFNTTTRNGDTVYGYNASSGINPFFNFSGNTSPVLTIYDGGGNDTLDLSGDTSVNKVIVTYNASGDPVYTTATRTTTVIDLRPGQYSSTHGMTNNIGIAFGTVIENAIGTQFNDTFYGNDANNSFKGGLGNDTADGGGGTDTAVFNGNLSSYTISMVGGSLRVVGPDGTDLLTNFEFLQFSDGTVAAANYLTAMGPLQLAIGAFGTSQGWANQSTNARIFADLNGDGKLDIVGFGAAATYGALGNGDGTFGSILTAINAFGTDAGWNNQSTNARLIADLNGDGKADIMGFGAAGTYFALGNGNGTFGSVQLATNSFGTDGGWATQEVNTRLVADVNGDGKLDIIGFGAAGTYFALGNGNGTFGGVQLATNQFGTDAGWANQNTNARLFADLNGDGRADLIGFGAAGTYFALGNGNGTFGSLQLATNQFGTDAGWANQQVNTRMLGDFDGDGVLDMIGFGAAGAYFARGNGDGTFAGLQLATNDFGTDRGWASQEVNTRFVADVNGDGKLDIIGFGAAGAYVAYGNGNGTFGSLKVASNNFGTDAGWANQTTNARFLLDINGDGKADIVGFGASGTYYALSQAGSGQAPFSDLVLLSEGDALNMIGTDESDRGDAPWGQDDPVLDLLMTERSDEPELWPGQEPQGLVDIAEAGGSGYDADDLAEQYYVDPLEYHVI